MLTKLDRYTIAECLPTFLLSLGVFSFILLMQRLAKLFDMVVAKGVPFTDVMVLLAYIFPTILPILLPISLLLAVLLAMGRLSADSEIVAMRSCGVGLAQNMKPILVLSITVGVVAGFTSLWLQPTAERKLKEALYETVITRINLSTEAGTFSNLSEGLTLYAEKGGAKEGSLEGIFIHSDHAPLEGATITAKSGTITTRDGDLSLNLNDVEISQFDDEGNLRKTSAARSNITLPVQMAPRDELKEYEIPTSTLYKMGYSEGEHRNSRMELHRRLAAPFSCIIVAILGGALGMHHSRSGKSRGVLLCLMIFFVYYSLTTLGWTLGKRERLVPWLAMWLPNIVMSAIAVYTYFRKNSERPLPLEEFLGAFFTKIASLFKPGKEGEAR